MSASAPVRNAERTRRAILDAAARLLMLHGAGVTIADVAADAGVSKGGLLHHFASRDALMIDVLRDTQERLRAEVLDRLDLSENQPGKLLRAYVRALCDGESELSDLLNGLAFWTGLEGVPGTQEVEQEDWTWWHEQLVADGLDPVLVRIVRRSAEGLAAARSYGDESAVDVQAAGAELIRLTLATR